MLKLKAHGLRERLSSEAKIFGITNPFRSERCRAEDPQTSLKALAKLSHNKDPEVKRLVAESLTFRLSSGLSPSKLPISQFDRTILFHAARNSEISLEGRISLRMMGVPVELATSELAGLSKLELRRLFPGCNGRHEGVLERLASYPGTPPGTVAAIVSWITVRSKEVECGSHDEPCEGEIWDGNWIYGGVHTATRSVTDYRSEYDESDVVGAIMVITKHPEQMQGAIMAELYAINQELAALISEKIPALRGPYR